MDALGLQAFFGRRHTRACGEGLYDRLRRRRSREQGAGQPAHETGALERRRRPERLHLQGVADVGPLRRRLATGTGGANDSAERRLTAEIPPPKTKPGCQI